MILLSDGEHNVPATLVADALKPRQAARLAEALGIRVHTVFVGPEHVSPGGSKEGEQALQDVAAMTGGRSFRASDAEALLDVCREIDHEERTRVESFQYYRYYEAYPWAGLGCIVIMLACFAFEGTRWLRVP
jgi:Ca-activated chloride channel family protein